MPMYVLLQRTNSLCKQDGGFASLSELLNGCAELIDRRGSHALRLRAHANVQASYLQAKAKSDQDMSLA